MGNRRLAVIAAALLLLARPAASQDAPSWPVSPTNMAECRAVSGAYKAAVRGAGASYDACYAAARAARERWFDSYMPNCRLTHQTWSRCAPLQDGKCRLQNLQLDGLQRCADAVRRYERARDAQARDSSRARDGAPRTVPLPPSAAGPSAGQRDGAPRRIALARPQGDGAAEWRDFLSRSGRIAAAEWRDRAFPAPGSPREAALDLVGLALSSVCARCGDALEKARGAMGVADAIRAVRDASGYAEAVRARLGLADEIASRADLPPVAGLMVAIARGMVADLQISGVERLEAGLADFGAGNGGYAAAAMRQFRATADQQGGLFAQQLRASLDRQAALPQDPLAAVLLAALQQATTWRASEERRRVEAYNRSASAVAAREAEANRRAAAERQRAAKASQARDAPMPPAAMAPAASPPAASGGYSARQCAMLAEQIRGYDEAIQQAETLGDMPEALAAISAYRAGRAENRRDMNRNCR